MNVRVLFFAYLRDVTKTPAVELAVAEGALVRDVWQAVIERWPALDAQLTRIPIVVDGKVVELDAPVREGSEVVWLPPVGGGASDPGAREERAPREDRASREAAPSTRVVRAAVTREALAPARLLSEVSAPNCGGIVVFVGEVRNNDEGRRVCALEYEAYEGLAQGQIRAVAEEAARRWPEARIAVEHRIGRLVVGEASVAVAVAAPHRAQAFECSRYVIDRVKEAIPIWKREEGEAGERWLEGHPYRPGSPAS